MNKLNLHTTNKADDNFIKLAEIFPNAVTETIVDGVVTRAIDKDVLMQEISAHVVEGNEERYQFTWPDKKKSVLLANAPNYKTLRPCREESINFDTTENLYIEGDNLDVLKLLQETYLGKVKMIYIDPPYNTGKDFVYTDDFKQSVDEYMDLTEQYDKEGNRLFTNSETNGRYHTDWLNMIYPRLRLAKDLLKDDGVIFISIDDNEVENLKKVCNEVFGAWNFIGSFVVNSTPNARDYGHIGKMHEFVLFYAKNIKKTKSNLLPEENKKFKYMDDKGGYNIHPLYNSNEAFTNKNRPNLYYPFYVYLDEKIDNEFYKIGFDEKESSIKIHPPKSVKNGIQFVWRWGKEKAQANINEEIVGYKTNDGEYRIVQKMRHDEKIIRSMLIETKYSSRRGTAELEELFNGKIFSFPKPFGLIYDFIKIGTDENDIILDFFSGSATTAHAAMQLNAEDGGHRKFIMVQLPEVIDEKHEAYKAGYRTICDIGKKRIRRAGEKIKEDIEKSNQQLKLDEQQKKLPDVGFRVLKCDSTNMKDVYYYPTEVDQTQLDMFTSNIKEDRSSEDLLFQVMLDLGVFLSCKIEKETVDEKNIFVVYQGDVVYLIACFDDKVSSEVVTAIAKRKPYYAVFRDSSMASDSLMTSFEQIFEAYSKDTVRKVL